MFGPLRHIGKTHIEIATKWIGTGATYGAASGAAVIYFTDWKLILQYLPYYNGKYAASE